jgi:hypothetical protein
MISDWGKDSSLMVFWFLICASALANCQRRSMAAMASSAVLPMVGVFRGGGFAFGGHVGDEAVGQAGWCWELPGERIF